MSLIHISQVLASLPLCVRPRKTPTPGACAAVNLAPVGTKLPVKSGSVKNRFPLKNVFWMYPGSIEKLVLIRTDFQRKKAPARKRLDVSKAAGQSSCAGVAVG